LLWQPFVTVKDILPLCGHGVDDFGEIGGLEGVARSPIRCFPAGSFRVADAAVVDGLGQVAIVADGRRRTLWRDVDKAAS
jgi:hypothetical protein